MLVDKDRDAEKVLLDITKAHGKAVKAANEAQAAHDLASEAHNRSVGELERSSKLVADITAFTQREKATPESIQALADECLSAELNLRDDQIQQLAENINNAIVGVADVDQIIADTADDLLAAQDLQRRAEAVQAEARAQLDNAENVTKALSLAEESQNAADIAITQTREDIDRVRADLGQIQNDMEIAVIAADNLIINVQDLGLRQKSLQTDFIKNENRVTKATNAALNAKSQADKANTELYQLNNGFKNVSGALAAKTASIGGAKDLALDLQRRANDLAAQASNKLSSLNDVEIEFEENERKLADLSEQLIKLNCDMMIHLQVIEDKSNFYRTCTPPATWTPISTCTCSPGAMEPSCTARRDVSLDY